MSPFCPLIPLKTVHRSSRIPIKMEQMKFLHILYIHLFTWSSRGSLFTSSSRNPWYSGLAWFSSRPWGSFWPPLCNGSTWRPRCSCMASFALVPFCSSLSRNSQRTLVHNKNVKKVFPTLVNNKKEHRWNKVFAFFEGGVTKIYKSDCQSKKNSKSQNASNCLRLNLAVLSVLVHLGLPYPPFLPSVLEFPFCPQPVFDWSPVQRTEKCN